MVDFEMDDVVTGTVVCLAVVIVDAVKGWGKVDNVNEADPVVAIEVFVK